MPIRSRSLVASGVVLALLVASPAQAAGLSGGLEGIFIIAVGLLIVFTVFGLVAWGVVLSVSKSRREQLERQGRPIPIAPTGLRILGGVQIVLAFVYGAAGFLQMMMPGEYENGRVAGWLQQAILFRLGFAALAVVSASGYRNRSVRLGFQLGMALGWLCVANFLSVLLFRGPYWFVGLDPISLCFGGTLLALLHWRYRDYFGAAPSELFRGVSKLFVRSVAAVAVVLVLLPATSLLVNAVFPRNRADAALVLKKASLAIWAYRDEHGDWPASLDDLDPPVQRYYRWHRMRYVPEEPRLEMSLDIAREPDLVYNATFGVLGGRSRIGAVVRTFTTRPTELSRS